MRGTRLYVAIAVVALFIIAGGVLIFANAGAGGTPRTLEASVTGGRMTPDPLVARQGDRLTIRITADQAGEIHLHGYDVHFEGKAGEVRTQSFRADRSGSFELEFEKTGALIGTLKVNP